MHIIPLFILMLIFLLNGISSSSFSSFNISAFIDLNFVCKSSIVLYFSFNFFF